MQAGTIGKFLLRHSQFGPFAFDRGPEEAFEVWVSDLHGVILG
jgi:hypothetical protein